MDFDFEGSLQIISDKFCSYECYTRKLTMWFEKPLLREFLDPSFFGLQYDRKRCPTATQNDRLIIDEPSRDMRSLEDITCKGSTTSTLDGRSCPPLPCHFSHVGPKAAIKVLPKIVGLLNFAPMMGLDFGRSIFIQYKNTLSRSSVGSLSISDILSFDLRFFIVFFFSGVVV